MAIKLSSNFDIIAQPTSKPHDDVIKRHYNEKNDNKEQERVATCLDNGTSKISNGAWFWAKLKNDLDNGRKDDYYIIFTKIDNNGKAYGTKVSAPNPPFNGDQNPVDQCK